MQGHDNTPYNTTCAIHRVYSCAWHIITPWSAYSRDRSLYHSYTLVVIIRQNYWPSTHALQITLGGLIRCYCVVAVAAVVVSCNTIGMGGAST